MEKSIERFLDFNGQKVYFLAADGVWWIAIKPICQALAVDYIRQFKNLKSDKILSPALSEQTIQVPSGKGHLQGRKMVCLPEHFVYGWIFKLKSDSKQLEEYQWKCYQLLYNYFHGTITERNKYLREHITALREAQHLERELLSGNEQFQRIKELRGTVRSCNKMLRKLDAAVVEGQLPIWEPGSN